MRRENPVPQVFPDALNFGRFALLVQEVETEALLVVGDNDPCEDVGV